MSISHVPDACLYLCACGLQLNSHQTSLDRVLLLSHIEVIKAQYNDSLYLSYFIFTCKSSLADPRLSTSISRQRFKKSRNTADSLSGFWSSGVPLVAIRYNAYKKIIEIYSAHTYQDYQLAQKVQIQFLLVYTVDLKNYSIHNGIDIYFKVSITFRNYYSWQ